MQLVWKNLEFRICCEIKLNPLLTLDSTCKKREDATSDMGIHMALVLLHSDCK